jgi:hypothetical protein
MLGIDVFYAAWTILDDDEDSHARQLDGTLNWDQTDLYLRKETPVQVHPL